MSTVSNVISLWSRFTSSTGTTVAPVIVSRNDDKSYDSRSGASRMACRTVGGPGRTVTRSASIFCITGTTSNTACGMIVAPRMMAEIAPAL